MKAAQMGGFWLYHMGREGVEPSTLSGYGPKP